MRSRSKTVLGIQCTQTKAPILHSPVIYMLDISLSTVLFNLEICLIFASIYIYLCIYEPTLLTVCDPKTVQLMHPFTSYVAGIITNIIGAKFYYIMMFQNSKLSSQNGSIVVWILSEISLLITTK